MALKKPLFWLGALSAVAGLASLIAGLVKVGERPAKLTWGAPDVKSALMTVGYKVYGNRRVAEGRHYLSKIVFKNEGEHPVTNFSISYKIDDYVDWTEPSVRKEIPPGFSFVELYYPRLPASVSKLRNATTTTARARIRWKEEGREREETLSRDLVLRAVNEIAYCDFPQSEAVLFTDYFSAAAFAAAMATPNDPVVDLYSSEITKVAGGTTAGIAGGPDEVRRICQAIYDYMAGTGLRYVGDSGVPANFDNIASYVQTVRLPRDVIINNQGLCIELSLLWSSILEHLGVRAAIMLVPGHAFIVAYSPDQGMPFLNGLPIECTAITPRAVGKDAPVSFPEAVKMAQEQVQHWMQDGRLIVLEVQQLQAAGFTPPELPDVDAVKLGQTLAARLAPEAAVAPAALAPAAPAPLPAADAVAPAPLSPDTTYPDTASGGGDSAWGSGTYRDPQGRFTLDILPGWTAHTVGDGAVEVSWGEASILISPFGGVNAGRQVVEQLRRQLQSQFRNFQMVSENPIQFGGRPGWNGRYTGINPKGTPTHVSLGGVDAVDGPPYGIIVSIPDAVYQQQRASVNQMMQSFMFSR